MLVALVFGRLGWVGCVGRWVASCLRGLESVLRALEGCRGVGVALRGC